MTTWAVNGGEAGASARALAEARDGASALAGQARPAARVGAPGAERTGEAAAEASRLAGSLLATGPARMGFVPQPRAMAAAARGYALAGAAPGPGKGAAARGPAARGASKGDAATSKHAATSKATAGKPSVGGSAPAAPELTATATELAFLADKRLSVEDKLFMFLALMEKKGNQELEQAMVDYAARRKAAKEAEKAQEADKAQEAEKAPKPGSSGGGGLLGGLVDAVQGVVKQVGGPLLASAATAVGLPLLAPAALRVGGVLGSELVGAVADLAGIEHGASRADRPGKTRPAVPGAPAPGEASTGPSTAASRSEVGDFDEKYEMAKIQRLQEKQNAMFSCLSNVLRAMHDTGMVAVNNLR